jgi:hypothetical protein
MAIVNLKDATVQRIFFDGKGIALYESFKVQGQDRKSYYTAWFDQAPGFTEGQVVSVSGLLSVKLREYEKDGQARQTVDVSLNKARETTGQQPPAQTPPAPAQTPPAPAQPATPDAWATTPSYTAETPF